MKLNIFHFFQKLLRAVSADAFICKHAKFRGFRYKGNETYQMRLHSNSTLWVFSGLKYLWDKSSLNLKYSPQGCKNLHPVPYLHRTRYKCFILETTLYIYFTYYMVRMCQMSDFAHPRMRIFNFNIRGCLFKIDFLVICSKLYWFITKLYLNVAYVLIYMYIP